MEPLVSIRVVTYNQERFIAACLESVLMQRTDFPIEVIVGEDCSTDGTRAIVRDYAGRFPDRIVATMAEQNVGALENYRRVRAAARGRYHAICEGDDYWTDPLKLQKQVDYLEEHPNSPMCFHDALIIADGKASPPRYFCPNDLPQSVSIREVILRPCFIPTGSMLIRGEVAASIPTFPRKVWCPDLISRLWYAHCGELGYLNELMSVRRRVRTGMSMTTKVTTLYDDTLYVYAEFDRLTEGRYAEWIAAGTQRIRREYADALLHRRFGPWYLLMRPRKLVTHLTAAFRGH
jgi:glycosyltransferase involved in cell wall biosynthesis